MSLVARLHKYYIQGMYQTERSIFHIYIPFILWAHPIYPSKGRRNIMSLVQTGGNVRLMYLVEYTVDILGNIRFTYVGNVPFSYKQHPHRYLFT